MSATRVCHLERTLWMQPMRSKASLICADSAQSKVRNQDSNTETCLTNWQTRRSVRAAYPGAVQGRCTVGTCRQAALRTVQVSAGHAPGRDPAGSWPKVSVCSYAASAIAKRCNE